MIKQTIEFTDYNGVKRKEDHFFNLSKAELLKMEMSTKGGYGDMVQALIDAQDTPAVYAVFEEMIHKAYGVKSADGREFIKNDEVRNKFIQSEAYSELIWSLAMDADKAQKFVNGLMPAELIAQLQKEQANAVTAIPGV